MNENMIQKIRESATVLNMADLFWSVLGKWRRILICALILALLLGGLSAARSFPRLHDTEYLRDVEARNAEAVRVYELNRKEYESQIDRYSLDLEQQEDYRTHCGLLALDPLHVYVCEGVYFVDTGSLFLDMLTREPNYNQAIIAAYSERLSALDERQVLKVAGCLFPDEEIDNYRGFLTVSADMGSSTLRYKAYGATEEQALALSAAVKEAVRSGLEEISGLICEHSIALLNERVALQSDEELGLMHTDFDANLSTTSINLSNAVAAMDALESPRIENPSRGAYLRSAVKRAILGFAAGAFLCAAAYAFAFVVHGTVADPDDVASRYSLPVLGVIPADAAKTGLDRRIAAHYGVPAGMSAAEGLRYAAVNLSESAGETLLLSGSGDPAVTGALAEKLAAEMQGTKLLGVGSICRDADALKAFHESGVLVFVETLQQSRHAELRRELIRAVESGKKVLGFLLLEK
jgi:hypothetical protein